MNAKLETQNSKLPARQLIRGLGLAAAISVVVGNVIGTGVFLKARVMTCNVGTPGRVIAVYVFAGLLSLAGALTYAELAAMMPHAGGEYVFMREAYGRLWAFLYGWMSFFIGKAGSQAALASVFAIFLNILLHHRLDGEYFSVHAFGFAIPFGKIQIVALASIAVVTAINCAAVRVSGGVATLLTGIKILLVLTIAIGGLLFTSGADWSHFSMANVGGVCEGVSPAARLGLAGFGAAMLGALWSYDGWNNVTLVAGEVKNPHRNLPFALIGGMLIVTFLYIFVNITYFYVLTPTQIASVGASAPVATEVARAFLGTTAVSFIAAALLSSSFGTLHTSILTGARVPYAMANDGLFFHSLSKISPRAHVPTGAVIAQAVWAGILTLSGSFDTLTDYAIFGLWIFYALVTASVFIFRKRLPDAERPYRTLGYPVVPILFLIVAAGLLLNTLWTTPLHAITGLGLIALGLPVYWYFAHRGVKTN
jgi:basic amino acid/polyamine antiporter, APA family